MQTILLVLIGLSFNFCIAQSQYIYVSDAENWSNPPWQILRFDENGQQARVFINSYLDWPQDILFIEDQREVLVSNLNNGTIIKYESYSGEYIDTFAFNLDGPTRMKIGPDSLLYVLQWYGDGLVKRFQLNGEFLDNFTTTNIPQAIGMDWDRGGNLYVSSYTQNYIRKFSPKGIDLGLFISSNLEGPTNIWFNKSGQLFVADYDGGSIKKFDANGQYLLSSAIGLKQSEGVAVYPNGEFLMGNGGDGSIKKFNADGVFISDFITPGSGGLIRPNAVILRTVDQPDLSTLEKPKLYVNPAVGTIFYIEKSAIGLIDSLTIFDDLGDIKMQASYLNQTQIDLSILADGPYYIAAKKEGEVVFQYRIYVRH
ncbi:MAG: hypothetical protein KJ941_06485 [Bacteroidetes bacterium]|nr:hypothetical protein [Bacteroidota bacterium]